MRILWFADSTLSPHKTVQPYNGCGWITSMHEELLKRDDIVLGVAMVSDISTEIETNSTKYYFIKRQKKTRTERFFGGIFPKNMKYEKEHWKYYEHEFLKVVHDFKPDVIQVFGSESYYGLIGSNTEIPLILHIQGILDTCRNAYFPIECSPLSYYLFDFNPKNIWSRFQTYAEWKRLSVREQEIFRRVHYFIGRTDWDKACTKILNPNAKYFFGEEILRPVFYNEPHHKDPEKCTITTTISAAMYKGFDNVLKAAKCLKIIMGDNFIWNVYGNVVPNLAEKITGIHHKEVNVHLKGVVNAEELCEILQNSTVYYHSSYIENTSNAIGEAQMQECPVIANYVGGIPSNLNQGKEGFLVPANDPYTTAYRIFELYNNPSLAKEMGINGRQWALKRHNRKTILENLISIYINIQK